MENWRFKYYPINNEITDEYWLNIEKNIPYIKDMSSTIQDKIHHGEGDVATHTRMVLSELLIDEDFIQLSETDKHILFTACLFHDIEKRSTTVIENDGRVSSRGHSKSGEKTARIILYKDIPTPFYIREHICKLIRFHGTPLWSIKRDDPNKVVIEVSVLLNTKLLEILARCDIKGRICNDMDELLERVSFFKELCIENKCYGINRKFDSNMSRFHYLNNGGSPDYVPFEKSNSFKVYIMSGIPGSGKDFYIKNNLKNITEISLDKLRREQKVKPTDKKATGRIVQMAKEMAKEKLRKKESFVWNATNITRQLRKQLVSQFMDYGAYVEIVYIESDYKKLIKQNNNREYKVPDKVLNKMIVNREVPVYSEAPSINYIINGDI